MSETHWLAAALLSSLCGMAWLALAMKVHWQQVHGADALGSPRGARLLRVLGASALLGSLLLCMCADHPSIAVLVWVMSLAAAALAVAFVLTWRPRLLVLLAPWAR